MEKLAGRILKSNNVKLEGQFRLNAGQGAQNPAHKKCAASAAPKVCIVENLPEFAVIEVTCGCGTKTYVRCEYNNGLSAQNEL